MIQRRQSLLECMVIGVFGGVLLICGSQIPSNHGLLALGLWFGALLGWLGYLSMGPASRASLWAGLGVVWTLVPVALIWNPVRNHHMTLWQSIRDGWGAALIVGVAVSLLAWRRWQIRRANETEQP